MPSNNDKQRSTWRLSNENYDFVLQQATAHGISMNGELNVMITEYRLFREYMVESQRKMKLKEK